MSIGEQGSDGVPLGLVDSESSTLGSDAGTCRAGTCRAGTPGTEVATVVLDEGAEMVVSVPVDGGA
jgi:hypothetical protein